MFLSAVIEGVTFKPKKDDQLPQPTFKLSLPLGGDQDILKEWYNSGHRISVEFFSTEDPEFASSSEPEAEFAGAIKSLKVKPNESGDPVGVLKIEGEVSSADVAEPAGLFEAWTRGERGEVTLGIEPEQSEMTFSGPAEQPDKEPATAGI